MTARKAAKDALPRSHVFVTLAYGRSARTFATRSGLAAVIAVIAPLLVLWFVGSSFFLVFHDDLVTTLLLRERDMQYGYEDRIATLRNQLDRESTQQLVTQRSVETKLAELSQREAELQGRSGVISRLEAGVARAGRGAAEKPLRVGTPIAFTPPPSTGVPALPGSSGELFGATGKPHPEATVEPPSAANGAAQHAASTLPDRLSLLSTDLDLVESAQNGRVAQLNNRVRKTIDHYHDALAAAGLSETRFAAAREGGSGGPFVPLTHEDDGSPFARAATGLQLTLSQAEQLIATVSHVPFSRPLQGDPEITSPFGPRVDPFLGRPAMHTGIDLKEDMGTEVRATAPGRVTIAGQASGYGTMVEIDHGAGLATRYAHLSEVDVGVGQAVKIGEIVGRVGATGRATGPHLHYETRIDGEAVDPLRFMAAGQKLETGLLDPM